MPRRTTPIGKSSLGKKPTKKPKPQGPGRIVVETPVDPKTAYSNKRKQWKDIKKKK